MPLSLPLLEGQGGDLQTIAVTAEPPRPSHKPRKAGPPARTSQGTGPGAILSCEEVDEILRDR